jgi:hypothetical protein
MGTLEHHITIEMQAVLCLSPARPVEQAQLQAAMDEVQEVLDEREELLALTQGASASANFAEGTVEIDVCLHGATITELQQQVLTILAALDDHCSLDIGAIAKQPHRRASRGERIELRPTGSRFVYA